MKKETGGCAFPGTPSEPGMSLRDYFVAHAPIDVTDANESLHQSDINKAFAGTDGVFPFPILIKELARLRGAYADAMLAERNGGAV